MTDSTIIKLGGRAVTDALTLRAFASEIAASTHAVAVVHGGGAELSELSTRLGMEPRFVDGIRMTSEAEMRLVDMVLAGLVNKRLVRALCGAGVRAVGCAGADAGTIEGTPVTNEDGSPSFTGTVESVRADLIRHLWSGGYVPVVAPPSSGPGATPLNINADDVALALAGATGTRSLVFLSDVDGVRIDGEIVNSLTPLMAEAQIASGEISGGMIPKVRNAIGSLSRGVGQVVIGSYVRAGDLSRLVEGTRGTTILESEEAE